MRIPRSVRLPLACALLAPLGAVETGCGADDSRVLPADCSMCTDTVACNDAYSACIQDGEDSVHCQQHIDGLCSSDGGVGDAGDAGDAGDGG